jgi:predicted peptidase
MHTETQTVTTEVVKPIRLYYRLWLPAAEVPAPWPLILFLHGSGERGDDLAFVEREGLPRRLVEGYTLPALVAAPQCPTDSDWELQTDALLALLDHLHARYPVDAGRVYLTGLSMGGRGTWLLALLHPERFAAAVPICGRRPGPLRPNEIPPALARLPIWAFHGARDTVVPVSETETIVAGLHMVGSDARCTIYPDLGHDSWTAAYAEPELERWLFAQQRPPSDAAVPTRGG